MTQVIADHWLSYRSYHIDVVGDEFTVKPQEELHMNSISFSLQRLQVEFDQFFLRASHMIVSSHRYVLQNQQHMWRSIEKGVLFETSKVCTFCKAALQKSAHLHG